MPQTCTIAEHPDRAELEALAAGGEGVRKLERRLSERYPGDEGKRLSKTALHRHLSRTCQCWTPNGNGAEPAQEPDPARAFSEAHGFTLVDEDTAPPPAPAEDPLVTERRETERDLDVALAALDAASPEDRSERERTVMELEEKLEGIDRERRRQERLEGIRSKQETARIETEKRARIAEALESFREMQVETGAEERAVLAALLEVADLTAALVKRYSDLHNQANRIRVLRGYGSGHHVSGAKSALAEVIHSTLYSRAGLGHAFNWTPPRANSRLFGLLAELSHDPNAETRNPPKEKPELGNVADQPGGTQQ